VAKSPAKTPIKIVVNFKRVKLSELTPAQLTLHKKFWTRLISECQREIKAQSEAKNDHSNGSTVDSCY